MAGDRVAQLVLAAAHEELVDLAELDPRDPAAIAILNTAVAEVKRRRQLATQTLDYLTTVGYLQIPRLADDSFQAQLKHLRIAEAAIAALQAPWTATASAGPAVTKADRLAAHYRQVIAQYHQERGRVQ